MTSNIELVEGTVNERVRQARKRMREAARTGEQIPLEEIAAARGFVLRERENSILSEGWIPIAMLVFIIGFFAGRNIPAMTLGALLLIMVGVGSWWKRQALVGVAYIRRFDKTHVFPGEPIELTVEAYNNKRLPMTWLQFRDVINGTVRVTGEVGRPLESIEKLTLTSSFTLASWGMDQRKYTLQFPTRGYYAFGPVTYEGGDLFTLFTREREHAYGDTLIVYPQIWPLEALNFPAKEPFGELKVRRTLFTDPIKTMGIRDYQPQDRFRDVHWKATARRGQLQTKIYDPSTGMTMVVFLNVATYEKYWMGHDPVILERLVSVVASILAYGAGEKWGIGVYANGSVPRSDQPIRVPPGHNEDQLMRVLEALAAVTGFSTGPLESLLQKESARVPWAATMLVVTASLTDEILITLRKLKEIGRRVAVVYLADEPPPELLGNIVCYHIPNTVDAFQPESAFLQDVTEAALASIPLPEAVELELVETAGDRLRLDDR